jgi:hypothetical protein
LVDVPFPITSATFDPNKHIISKNNNTTLGVQSLDWTNVIQVVPNPAYDYLTVEIPESIVLEEVIVVNQLGQNIVRSSKSKLNVNGLSRGVYYLNISTSAGTFYKKFIKN